MNPECIIFLNILILALVIVPAGLLFQEYVNRSNFIEKLNPNTCFTNETSIVQHVVSTNNGEYKTTNIIYGNIGYIDNNINYFYNFVIEITDSHNEAVGYRKKYDDFVFMCFTNNKIAFLDKPNELIGNLAGGIIILVVGMSMLVLLWAKIIRQPMSTIYV